MFSAGEAITDHVSSPTMEQDNAKTTTCDLTSETNGTLIECDFLTHDSVLVQDTPPTNKLTNFSNMKNNNTPSKRTFSVVVTAAEFEQIKPRRLSRGFVNDWRNLFYGKFNAVITSCALQFLPKNHCKKPLSRKQGLPYWTGAANCRTGSCITVSFTVDSEPVEGQDMPVRVSVFGICNHAVPDDQTITVFQQNRRPLSGAARTAAASIMNTTGVKGTSLYYSKLGEMPVEECIAGNTTACQSGSIFRQAAYQQRLSTRLHDNIMTELQIQKEALVSALPGTTVKGFIHTLGMQPFVVTFYMEAQLKAYIDKCVNSCDCVLHFDSTGSIIHNIKNQKRPFYYCLLMADDNLPVFEFLSTSHTMHCIRAQLESWNHHVRLVNNGQTVKPNYIVTDFSFALIQACIQVFNQHSLGTYLNETYNILSNRCNEAKIASLTFLSICVAHMLKCVSMRLVKVEKNPVIRRFCLVCFSALQRSNDLVSAAALYRNIFVVLSSKCTNAFVEECNQELSIMLTEPIDVSRSDIDECDSHALLQNETDSDQKENYEVNEFEMSTHTAKTLKSSSPFTTFFAGTVADVDCENSHGSANVMYSPRCLEVLCSYMHLFPLWSAALQNDAHRFGCNSTGDRRPTNTVQCRSNAIVESHFSSTKNERLRGRLRIRPRDFVDSQLQYLRGKLNERVLPKVLIKRKHELQSHSESWRPKKKKALYSNPETAAKVLKSLQKKNAIQPKFDQVMKSASAALSPCSISTAVAHVDLATSPSTPLSTRTPTFRVVQKPLVSTPTIHATTTSRPQLQTVHPFSRPVIRLSKVMKPKVPISIDQGSSNAVAFLTPVKAEVPLQPPMSTDMVEHAVVEPKNSSWEPLMRSYTVTSMSVSKTASSSRGISPSLSAMPSNETGSPSLVEEQKQIAINKIELSDEEMNECLFHLRRDFTNLAGLEDTGLGQFQEGDSLPRFHPAGNKPFVQILNVGDHWVCVTNRFTANPNCLYWYDSFPTGIMESAVVQLSSILRATETNDSLTSATDNLTVHVRSFSRQSSVSRLCGYYAVAAAIAVCNNVDPTGFIYQALPLVKAIKDGMKRGQMMMVPVDEYRRKCSIRNITYKKLYCICRKPWLDFQMVECTECRNWYHTKCIKVSPVQIMQLSLSWLCQSCTSDKATAECLDLEEFESNSLRPTTSTPFSVIHDIADEYEANRVALSIPADEETVSFRCSP